MLALLLRLVNSYLCLFVVKSSKVFIVLVLNGMLSFVVSLWLRLCVVRSSKAPSMLTKEMLFFYISCGGMLTF